MQLLLVEGGRENDLERKIALHLIEEISKDDS